MAALEDASSKQLITPFAKFLGKLVQEAIDGKAVAKVPNEEGVINSKLKNMLK